MAHPVAEREAIFQQGLETYRSGLHWEAHELWEQLWEDEDDDDHRRFLQALIQVASAVHKVTHDVEPRGSLRLIERALGRIEGLPEVYGGVAVAPLRIALARYREALASRLGDDARSLTEAHRRALAELVPPIAREGDALAWRSRPREAAPNLAAAMTRGLGAYARGAFYEAHEHWEEPWRDDPDPAHKRFLQGLILVAASMHKLHAMKSPPGALRLIERAIERLDGIADGTDGIAVDDVRDGAERARAALARFVAGDAESLPPDLAPRIRRL